MVTMHGFFDLKPNQDEQTFKAVYDRFGDFLIKEKLITAHKTQRRSYDDNYDSSPPETKYYVSMDFVDLKQSQDCWAFIEQHSPESAKLHRDVFARITNYAFFLSEDIPAAGES